MSKTNPPVIPGYEFVRRGTTTGWSHSGNLLYACEKCGGTMPAHHNDYFTCSCGALHLDIDAGRFDSQFGDNAILTYRKLHSV